MGIDTESGQKIHTTRDTNIFLCASVLASAVTAYGVAVGVDNALASAIDLSHRTLTLATIVGVLTFLVTSYACHVVNDQRLIANRFLTFKLIVPLAAVIIFVGYRVGPPSAQNPDPTLRIPTPSAKAADIAHGNIPEAKKDISDRVVSPPAIANPPDSQPAPLTTGELPYAPTAKPIGTIFPKHLHKFTRITDQSVCNIGEVYIREELDDCDRFNKAHKLPDRGSGPTNFFYIKVGDGWVPIPEPPRRPPLNLRPQRSRY